MNVNFLFSQFEGNSKASHFNGFTFTVAHNWTFTASEPWFDINNAFCRPIRFARDSPSSNYVGIVWFHTKATTKTTSDRHIPNTSVTEKPSNLSILHFLHCSSLLTEKLLAVNIKSLFFYYINNSCWFVHQSCIYASYSNPHTHNLPFLTHHHHHHRWYRWFRVRLLSKWLFEFCSSFCETSGFHLSFEIFFPNPHLVRLCSMAAATTAATTLPIVVQQTIESHLHSSDLFHSIHFISHYSDHRPRTLSKSYFWQYFSKTRGYFYVREFHSMCGVNWMRILSTMWHWFHFGLIDSLRFNTRMEMIMTFESSRNEIFSVFNSQWLRIIDNSKIPCGFLLLTIKQLIEFCSQNLKRKREKLAHTKNSTECSY